MFALPPKDQAKQGAILVLGLFFCGPDYFKTLAAEQRQQFARGVTRSRVKKGSEIGPALF